MNSSIFDNLQIIQVTDDDSNNLYNNQVSHENIDSNHHPGNAEENVHLKVSTSTKPSAQMTSSWSQKSKSSLTKHTLPSKKSINHENMTIHHQNTSIKGLKKLNDNDKFACQSCIHQSSQFCEICQGKTQLTGNDRLVKFFEYVMEFKLGKRQSYRTREEKISSKRTVPNEHCSIYFSTINHKPPIQKEPHTDVRFSLCNDNIRQISTILPCDLSQNIKEIHYGYGCDQCQTDPIEGPRYHCNECGDFDLCETCYERNNHYHQLQKIQIKQNKKALEKISNLLKFTSQSGIRSSIKNTGGIRNTISCKSTKSWIR